MVRSISFLAAHKLCGGATYAWALLRALLALQVHLMFIQKTNEPNRWEKLSRSMTHSTDPRRAGMEQTKNAANMPCPEAVSKGESTTTSKTDQNTKKSFSFGFPWSHLRSGNLQAWPTYAAFPPIAYNKQSHHTPWESLSELFLLISK